MVSIYPVDDSRNPDRAAVACRWTGTTTIDCSVTALMGAQKGSYGAIDGSLSRYFSPAPGSSSVAPRESATKA